MYTLTMTEQGIKLWYEDSTAKGVIVYTMDKKSSKKYKSKREAVNDKKRIEAKDDVSMTVEEI